VKEDALDACADEPIRVPGAIQPHGTLLAVTEPDLEVAVASANAPELFGTEVTGRSVEDLLPAQGLVQLREGLATDLSGVNPLRV
jgi:chemotaxis family two-component system sensor kinase Cph1